MSAPASAAPQIQPLSYLDRWPRPDGERAAALFAQAFAGFTDKIVVLDDDPTGVQTVHDVAVYTDWSLDTLRAVFRSPEQTAFLLTNSRSFSAEKTEAVHREIAEHIAAASLETGRAFVLISRSDSTLRGHYPLETQTLRATLEAKLGQVYDGEILLPFFREGGRFTVGDVHYVQENDRLVPAGMTEFAKDATFGYAASDLKDWCEEKTAGAYRAQEVVSISLDELRRMDISAIVEKLMAVHGFGKVVVNAASYADVFVFAAAFLRAHAAGKRFLFRASAAIVKILGNISDQPLLSHDRLVAPENTNGGVVIVGSHVRKTTMQLEALRSACPDLAYLCFDVSQALTPGALEHEHDAILAQLSALLSSGRTAVVYTSRTLLKTEDKEQSLALSVRISDAITSLVAQLSVRPAFVLAKGGITSSDVGVKALQVKKATVLGQIAPGIPVWQTGAESRFPSLPYVIFPGNVGGTDTLAQVVKVLLGRA